MAWWWRGWSWIEAAEATMLLLPELRHERGEGMREGEKELLQLMKVQEWIEEE